VGQTQGDCVRSAQNVRTRGGVDLVAGARSKGGFGDSYSARKSCCWRPSRGGCVSCGSGCWSRYWGSRGVWARSVHRQWSGSARAADYRLMTCSCPMWIIPTSLMQLLGRPFYGIARVSNSPRARRLLTVQVIYHGVRQRARDNPQVGHSYHGGELLRD
jgi:hypothetical protein